MIKICLQKLDFYKTLYLKPNKTKFLTFLASQKLRTKYCNFLRQIYSTWSMVKSNQFFRHLFYSLLFNYNYLQKIELIWQNIWNTRMIILVKPQINTKLYLNWPTTSNKKIKQNSYLIYYCQLRETLWLRTTFWGY